MIIDLILDRKDLEKDLAEQGATMAEYAEYYRALPEQQKIFSPTPYEAGRFYREVREYDRVFDGIGLEILRAMDYGTKDDVKKALCRYITKNEYNPEICDFINGAEWLGEYA